MTASYGSLRGQLISYLWLEFLEDQASDKKIEIYIGNLNLDLIHKIIEILQSVI